MPILKPFNGMQITKADATWNLIATTLRVASGIIVLPLVLYFLPQEDLALWTIFLSFGAMVILLDFGFAQTFSRNITYIFSGARALKSKGYTDIDELREPDYALLKGVIRSMRFFYGVISVFFLMGLLTAGSYYIWKVLETYRGDKQAVITAWALFAVIVAAQLYTLLYDVLMQGRGMIRRNKQILALAQLVQIGVTAGSLVAGCGIIAMVYGQLAALVVNRILAHLAFYDKQLRESLRVKSSTSIRDILNITAPNAARVGITALGGFLASRAGIFITSLYLPLSDIASYGITQQVIDILVSISVVWLTTFYPRITQFRVTGDPQGVKRLYLKSRIFYIAVYAAGAAFLLLWGNDILLLIHSKTLFLPVAVFAVGLAALYIETRYTLAAYMLLSKNEVPYYKASLLAGLVNVVLLFIFVVYLQMGILSIFVARGISMLYNGIKWPHDVKRELRITFSDYKKTTANFGCELLKRPTQ